jgi:hypothetical protein
VSTTNEFARVAQGGGSATISAADTDFTVADIPRVEGVGATWARIGAVCDTLAATLAGQWLLFDSVGNIVGATPVVTFTAGGVVQGGNYVGTPGTDALVRLAGAFSFLFLVSAVSAGNWALDGRVYFPGNPQ